MDGNRKFSDVVREYVQLVSLQEQVLEQRHREDIEFMLQKKSLGFQMRGEFPERLPTANFGTLSKYTVVDGALYQVSVCSMRDDVCVVLCDMKE